MTTAGYEVRRFFIARNGGFERGEEVDSVSTRSGVRTAAYSVYISHIHLIIQSDIAIMLAG
jgi:hypothetical protein